MFFSGRRALLGTEWDSYFLVPGNLEFPLVCFRVFCVPGVFRILGLHLGDHCLGSENFLSFPRLSQSNFFISISAAESGDIWGPGFLPHWYHPFWL